MYREILYLSLAIRDKVAFFLITLQYFIPINLGMSTAKKYEQRIPLWSDWTAL